MSEAGPNAFEPDWEREMDVGPFGLKGARLAAAAGAEKIGLSVYEIAPGRRNMPFHAHHGIEELIVVLRGEPTAAMSGEWGGADAFSIVLSTAEPLDYMEGELD